MTIEKRFMWRKGLILSATFFCALFMIFACKKKNSTIGQGNLNQNTLLESGIIDTFTINTYSYLPDSIVSSNPAFAMLGEYNDPVFGNFDAEFYTQVRLAGFNPNFGDLATLTVDSFVLSLEYIGSYGDAGEQFIEVYEMGEDIYDTASYYSFTTIPPLNPTDLVQTGLNSIDFDPSKLTVIDGDTVSPQLRIPLNPAKALELMTEASTGSSFADNEAFLQYFKGFHIKTNNAPVNSGDGGTFYFNLADPDSKLTIYYTQNGQAESYDFSINTSCATFNHVEIDNSMTDVENVINDTVSGNIEYYAQAYGSRAVIEMPSLDSVPANAVIHDAYIDLPVSFQTGSKYTPGYDASVAIRLEAGSTQLFGLAGVDATYNDFTKSFRINLRSYVQALVTGELENTGVIISPSLYNTTADRIIFNGRNSFNKAKPQFSILYTTF